MINTPIHLYHIVYSQETLVSAPIDSLILNNIKNERPDWFEYWPIRKFLLSNELDDNAYYGFFSPRFLQKTGMSYIEVKNFIKKHSKDIDIFLFSPQPDIGAFFINPFEGGDLVNPGKIEASEEFLKTIGVDINLRSIVMDSRKIVFSNYFVAKPDFWKNWLSITEKLFFICEGEDTPLKRKLTAATNYGKGAQRKIFIIEAIASLLLALQNQWRVVAKNPFELAWSATFLNKYQTEAYVCDALKTAFLEQGFIEYMHAYYKIRGEILQNNN